MFFFVISQIFDAIDYSNYVFLGFCYNSVIQALLVSNILCLFISTEVSQQHTKGGPLRTPLVIKRVKQGGILWLCELELHCVGECM